MNQWTSVLELDTDRTITAGSTAALAAAIRAGADLRIYTEFHHDEHIDVTSTSHERVREVAEFGVTYLIDGRWVAGIMSLRQPVELPAAFGPRPSMSFFLYNQNGRQAIARPYLDGPPAQGTRGSSTPGGMPGMRKYHAHDQWDADTNGPSSNFTYDFERYRYFVNQGWTEQLNHDDQGRVRSGSVTGLADAFSAGQAVKVGVSGLCADLGDPAAPLDHELFVEVGSCYYYEEQQLFIAGSHPVIRVRPGIPLEYRSGGWDFGWLLVRTDGQVVYRRCDPYSLAFRDERLQLGVRWFVR